MQMNKKQLIRHMKNEFAAQDRFNKDRAEEMKKNTLRDPYASDCASLLVKKPTRP